VQLPIVANRDHCGGVSSLSLTHKKKLVLALSQSGWGKQCGCCLGFSCSIGLSPLPCYSAAYPLTLFSYLADSSPSKLLFKC
jgi:hypothetical protein